MMDKDEQIDAFNESNAPFYIVELNNGKFSLCLPLDFLRDEYYDYCQHAFDAYAKKIGDPPIDQHGFRTHGNGYEWEAAFREAFKDDPNIGRISFDCEAGGFFCDSDDLAILVGLGIRFKKICENTALFADVVSDGVQHMKEYQAQQEQLEKTVRGQLMQRADATFEIMTPDGDIRITPEDIKRLLNKEIQYLTIGDKVLGLDEFLNQEISETQVDLFDRKLIRMKTEEEYEQNFISDFLS